MQGPDVRRPGAQPAGPAVDRRRSSSRSGCLVALQVVAAGHLGHIRSGRRRSTSWSPSSAWRCCHVLWTRPAATAVVLGLLAAVFPRRDTAGHHGGLPRGPVAPVPDRRLRSRSSVPRRTWSWAPWRPIDGPAVRLVRTPGRGRLRHTGRLGRVLQGEARTALVAGRAGPPRRGGAGRPGCRGAPARASPHRCARCTTCWRTGCPCWRRTPVRWSTGPTPHPSGSRQAAGVIRAGIREALAELRDVITLLRGEDDGPLHEPSVAAAAADLAWTCRDWSRSATEAGMVIAVDAAADAAVDVPVQIGRAAYRVVQEGLTNARRHAPGQPGQGRRYAASPRTSCGSRSATRCRTPGSRLVEPGIRPDRPGRTGGARGRQPRGRASEDRRVPSCRRGLRRDRRQCPGARAQGADRRRRPDGARRPDDDAGRRRRRSGWSARPATGSEVPDAVAKHHPDVVLMDLHMPRVDGIAATRRLRRGVGSPGGHRAHDVRRRRQRRRRPARPEPAASCSRTPLPNRSCRPCTARRRVSRSCRPRSSQRLMDQKVESAADASARHSPPSRSLSERESEVAVAVARGRIERRDRHRPAPQRGHREGPRLEHPGQAGHGQPHAARRAGPRRRAGLSRLLACLERRGSRGGLQRQPDPEHAAPAGLAVDLDPAAVALDDRLGDAQAEADALDASAPRPCRARKKRVNSRSRSGA